MAVIPVTDKNELARLATLRLSAQQIADFQNNTDTRGRNYPDAVDYLWRQSFNPKLGTYGNVG